MRRRRLVSIALALVALLATALPVFAWESPPIPPCRWAHSPGYWLDIYYTWGDRLQGSSLWRTAFQAGINDWNAKTRRTWFKEQWAWRRDIVNTYDAIDGNAGLTFWYCQNGSASGADVKGNVWYDIDRGYSVNHRQSVAGHELGHGLYVGHNGGDAIALMGFNPNPNVYYRAIYATDIALVNSFYP